MDSGTEANLYDGAETGGRGHMTNDDFLFPFLLLLPMMMMVYMAWKEGGREEGGGEERFGCPRQLGIVHLTYHLLTSMFSLLLFVALGFGVGRDEEFPVVFASLAISRVDGLKLSSG